ncbi:MAG: glycosyltransferase, partial [Prolixibacteraceae bacterium]|nr:glycosyltransferase [Burkholderiales bacterium]
MTSPPIRMLFFMRDEFPTHRADVDILFGRELVGRGHAIDFVMQAISDQTPVGSVPWHGRTAFVGPTRSAPGLSSRVLKQWLGFRHDLSTLCRASSDDYDAIQVRDKFFIAAIAMAVARARGLKFFFWLSFPFPEDDILRASQGQSRFDAAVSIRGRLCAWLLYKWISPRCDHLFVQSERMKTEVCARGAIAAKTTPVPMGVDLAELPVAPAGEVKELAGVPVLGYLGTLDANRKLGILIEMLVELKRHGMIARLLLIGDASDSKDRQALEALAVKLGVADFVEITGFMPRIEALRRIRQADVCLSPIEPSPVFRVGSPTKMVEYLGAGIPVVANDHPEQQLILRACRGGVCVPWGARHFARGVRWLLTIDAE